MTNRTTFLVLLLGVSCFLAPANSWRQRTPAEKVAEAELIVHGVATLEGLPLENTERPVARSCRVVILQTLWPTNRPATNIIIVNQWAWTNWPDTWWDYNSKTGVYFLERTTTTLRRARAHIKPQGARIPDNVFGTNVWTPLSRFDDWYEPATNIAIIQRLIRESKK
jgi:hypothetical protein